MPPPWLVAVAWCWLGLCFLSAIFIVFDIAGRGHRQRMPVMEWVWPITALYLGPLALLAYWRYGRLYAPTFRREHPEVAEAPGWVRVGISTSHCGAGCTLGDIVAETLVFVLALTLFGAAIYASFVLDYLFAFTLGVVFQYFAITQMGTRDWRELARRTLKADAYSLTAFEVGLFAWMALTWFVFFPDPHLTPTNPVFWFMMQIGMAIGFGTSFPANAWLIRRGVKESM